MNINKILFNILALLFIQQTNVTAQSAIVWQKTLGGTAGDYAHSVQQTFDGGYVVAGLTASNNGDVSANKGNDDFWLVKMNALGELQWSKTFGGTGFDQAYSVYPTDDSGFVMAGFSGSTNGDVDGGKGSDDFWIIKLNSAGEIIWKKCFGGTSNDNAFSIKQTNDGGYIIIGDTFSKNGDVFGNKGNYDTWIIKLDKNANIIWAKCYGGTNDDTANSIVPTTDGGYVFVGSSKSSNGDLAANKGNWDVCVIKIDSLGNVIWAKNYGGTNEDIGYAIQLSHDSGYIVSGFTKSNNLDVSGNHSAGIPDVWLFKLSDTGAVVWQKCLGGTGDDKSYSLILTSDSNYVIAGYTRSNDGDVRNNQLVNFQDFWIVKLDQNANIISQACLGGTSDDWARSVIESADGSYVVTGWTKSNNGDVTLNKGGNDLWILKLDNNLVGTNNIKALNFNIYPNPNNGVFQIQINDEYLPAELNVVNALSQKVFTKKLDSNYHQIELKDLPKGLYTIQITSKSNSTSKKIIVR